MTHGFSEKEYEFTFAFQFFENNELLLAEYPFMPSSRVEGTQPFDIGFHLIQEGTHFSIFFQFKLSKYVRYRKNTNSIFFDRLGSPFYYFKIWPRTISNQHNLMCEMWETGENVYYAAPTFHLKTELFQNIRNRTTINNSVFCDPREIGLIQDDNRHKVAFNSEDDFGYFASEPRRIQLIKTFETVKKCSKPRKIDEEYISNLFSFLKRSINVKEILNYNIIPKQVQKLPQAYQCSYLLSKYYGLKWMILKG